MRWKPISTEDLALYDTVVIGAGHNGLAAAIHLATKGRMVVVAGGSARNIAARASQLRIGTVALRTVVLFVGGAEALLIVAFVGVLLWGSYPWTDSIGWTIASGLSILAAAVLIGFVIPALVLGLSNRWLGLASVLIALAPVAAVLAWWAA